MIPPALTCQLGRSWCLRVSVRRTPWPLATATAPTTISSPVRHWRGAFRILHALITESERHGYQVSNADPRGRDDARRRAKDSVAHVVIAINSHSYSLAISEGKVGLRGVWEEQKRLEEEWRRRWPGHSSGSRPKPYDVEASGQLSISLVAAGYPREGRPSSWSDRKSWTLDEKLPELLYELPSRIGERITIG